MIRHGAKLVHAFAEATVPKVTVVLRKAFGGAFIAMNARDLGADYTFAWPQAQLGVMGAKQAVTIVKRRDIAAAEDPAAAREEFAEEYADEHLSASHRRGRGLHRRGDPAGRHAPPAERGAVDARRDRPARAGREEHPAMTPAITDTISWWAPFEALEPGQEFTTRGRTVTEADVVGFASLSGDWHPQHCDAAWAAALAVRRADRPRHARRSRSPRASCRSTRAAWSRCAGVADATFKRPVRFGDTLRVEGRVADLGSGSEEAGLVTFAWNVVNQDDQTVCRARVEVLWRRDVLAELEPERERRLRPDPTLRWASSTARSS